MPDYKKCVIYTIKSGEGLYVGSTCNFNQRKYKHKSSLNNENDKNYNLKLYKTIRENGGEWSIQPHAEFPCKSKMEMCIEEERVRQELKADLNSNSCFLTEDERLKYQKDYKKDYYINNKEAIAVKDKNKYIKNKEKLTEKFTCECGGKYTHQGSSQHFKSQKHSNYMLSKEA